MIMLYDVISMLIPFLTVGLPRALKAPWYFCRP